MQKLVQGAGSPHTKEDDYMTEHNCTCHYCKASFKDSIEGLDICTNCENEFAEYLDAKGLVVGEFDDRSHPNYQPEPFKGTKWERQPTVVL